MPRASSHSESLVSLLITQLPRENGRPVPAQYRVTYRHPYSGPEGRLESCSARISHFLNIAPSCMSRLLALAVLFLAQPTARQHLAELPNTRCHLRPVSASPLLMRRAPDLSPSTPCSVSHKPPSALFACPSATPSLCRIPLVLVCGTCPNWPAGPLGLASALDSLVTPSLLPCHPLSPPLLLPLHSLSLSHHHNPCYPPFHPP